MAEKWRILRQKIPPFCQLQKPIFNLSTNLGEKLTCEPDLLFCSSHTNCLLLSCILRLGHFIFRASNAWKKAPVTASWCCQLPFLGLGFPLPHILLHTYYTPHGTPHIIGYRLGSSLAPQIYHLRSAPNISRSPRTNGSNHGGDRLPPPST